MDHHHPSKKMTSPPEVESEPKLLLPTKVYEHHHHPEATTTDGRQPVYHHHPNIPVRWTAQPVMQWLESLVAATENAEMIQQEGEHNNYGGGPIMVQNVRLSEHTTRPPIVTPSTSVAAAPLARPNDDDNTNVQPFRHNHHPVDHDECWTGDSSIMPRQWDLTFLQQRDPFAGKYTRQMSSLACQLEQQQQQQQQQSIMPDADNDNNNANDDDLAAAYQMVQTRLEFTFGRILAQFPYGTCTEFGEIRLLLNTLYSETIQKLQTLVDKAKEPTDTTTTTIAPTPTHANKQEGSRPPPVIPKKDFSKYMTCWLRDNWTNPYPDVPGMAEMAQDCGVTPEVVSNWLINARTRKWRPALLKATELHPHRPASLLYEDSINIFDGKPLRDLDDDDDDDNNDTDNYESVVQPHATVEGNGKQGEVHGYDCYCCNQHPNKRLKRTDL